MFDLIYFINSKCFIIYILYILLNKGYIRDVSNTLLLFFEKMKSSK